jgi:hypothetical protein
MKRARLAAAVLTAFSASAASAQSWDRHEHRQEGRERPWRSGQYLPSQYRSGAYVVSDYSRYGLGDPGRGYQYVRNGDNLLLTAIASGLIGAVIGHVLTKQSQSYGQRSYGYGQQTYGYGEQTYGYGQPSYGYGQPSYGYGDPYRRPIRGYDRYGRPIY